MKTRDGFTIRLATNDDLLAIRAVLFSVRCEFGVIDETGTSDKDLSDLAQNYFAGGGVFEVIEEWQSNQIVGCAGLRPRSRRRVELCKMYILKSARGHGLGKRLLEDLLAAARRGGFSEVWLETNSVLAVATSLYEKYGFQPVDSDDLRPRCDQAYLLKLM
jgi:putative acetyltransferase